MSLESGDVEALAKALQALHSSTAAAVPSVSSVAIKLPPFWATQSEVWFRQVEAQFATRNPPITADLTKFNHVVAALDNVTAGEVEAIILSSPTNDKYEALKAALIGAFGRSQASKDMEFLSLTGLGDRKPSSLLRYMESLNADPKTLLRALFLAQLPIEVRRVPAGSPTADLKDLAKEADAIMEAGSLRSSAIGIAEVHKPTSSATTNKPKQL